MKDSVLNSNRNRQVLADIVRAYVATGEPVSSRTISRSHAEQLSSASIRNVMADLEDAGLLFQPHVCRARPHPRPPIAFCRADRLASDSQRRGSEWIRKELEGATTAEEITERAGHMLAAVSRGLGIVIMPPLAHTVLDIYDPAFPDGRVVVVLISVGGATRDKVLRSGT